MSSNQVISSQWQSKRYDSLNAVLMEKENNVGKCISFNVLFEKVTTCKK